MNSPENTGVNPSQAQAARLSYKFQRLRERLRQAIVSGELAGKLPGERDLAVRFKANPKTLSKALTDLAAEGLLERSIGRGTFVRGAAPAPARTGRWLVLADPGQMQSPLVERLRQRHSDIEIANPGMTDFRPSFVNQFTAVVDLAVSTPDSIHRDLLLRGMSVLLMNREPGCLKLHSILFDRAYAASSLFRQIVLAGYRRIVVVEDPSDCTVSSAVRLAAGRYGGGVAVESGTPAMANNLAGAGDTAVLCDGEDRARQVLATLHAHDGVSRIALTAVGTTSGDPPCSGIFADISDLAQAADDLLRDASMHKPVVLWLLGGFIDRRTLVPLAEPRMSIVSEPHPTALSA